MTTLSHPFLDNAGPMEMTSEQKKDVDEVYQWMQQQVRFPNFSKNHAHLFLHACYWDQAAAKKALQKYTQIRAGSPDVFANRDPTSATIQQVFDLSQMVGMPKTTPEGYQILIYRLMDTDPSKIHFAECMKAFCMFNDVRLSEDGLANGYIVIFDMKGVRLGHLTRVQFGPLRAFMSYIQEGHPARLKKIYIVNASSFINQIMAIIRPLIKSEMMSLLQFTASGPQELFSKDLLPKEYDGDLESTAKYFAEQRKRIETVYRDWLIESGELKEKPKEKSKGKGKVETNNNIAEVTPPIRSFNALEID